VSALPESPPHGWELFARYAFPPNELGYCGPPDSSVLLRGSAHDTGPAAIASHAQGFDGAWPYLEEIAAAAGRDPLDTEVVRSYWVGGPLLDKVDAARLVDRLRTAFAGQPTGLLTKLGSPGHCRAHHSFHVFVVYPWVGFLDMDPATPMRILQACRIRWGTVDSVDDEHATIISRPLTFDGALALGPPAAETVRWSKNGTSLAPLPNAGDTVAAHWDWVCGTLDEDEADALARTTHATLDLVNRTRTS
jgi:Family of unknown function (DUF6390)